MAAAPWRAKLAANAPATQQAQVLSWWRGLNDPIFADLATQALQGNLNLAQMRQRIVEARARRGVVNAERLPQIDSPTQYERAGSGPDSLSFAGPPPGIVKNLYATGVVANWEVDLWGRVQRLVDAADDQTRAAVDDYRDAAVSLLSELALAYIDVRTLHRRLDLVEQNVMLQRRTLELAESRYAAGNGPAIDVTQARRLLRQTQSRVPELRRARIVAENRVAILLGKRPADGVVPPGGMPQTPPPADMRVPADLITRRADVRRADWKYRAALAQVDAAEAERLPRLTVSGSFHLSAGRIGNLFDQAYVYSFGPQLTFPIFEGGRISANVRVHKSQAEQARLQLEQTLLTAIEEVENAATGYMHKREEADELEAASAAAESSAALAEQLYRSGLRDLTQSIDAQRQLVNIQDSLALTRQEVLGQAVQLYRALGGGWEMIGLNGEVIAPTTQPVQSAEATATPPEGAS